MVEMIDLTHLESYRENNRIEAKKALGGLPHSLWETYSSFANTFGGVILLGVEEKKDHTFLVHDLPDPQAFVEEIWQIVSDKRYVSENILQKNQVRILLFEEKQIVAIFVPRADKRRRPIYIGTDAYTGTYRRDGEGDYHCSRDEVDAMYQEAKQEEEDTQLLTGYGTDAFDKESIQRYRRYMEQVRPEHIWHKLDMEHFLEKLQAAARDMQGNWHPTAAGLLMFGKEPCIVQEYPCYALFYQEMGKNGIWNTILSSDSGEWSGNLYEFFVHTYRCICRNIRIPASYERKYPGIETPIHNAIKELLVNCLVHADYREKQGVVVLKSGNKITFENPGCFGVDTGQALSGSAQNHRHPVLIQMFHLIHLGNGEGRGISDIYAFWRKCGFALPKITEQGNPQRTQIVISVGRKRTPVTAGSEFRRKRKDSRQVIYESCRQQVIDYVTVKREVHTGEIVKLLDMEFPKVKQLLARMVEEGVLENAGDMGNHVYRLKR